MRILILLLLAGSAFADEPDEPSPSPSPAPVEVAPPPPPLPPPPLIVPPPPLVPPSLAKLAVEHERTYTWPFTIDAHVLVGAEFHEQGTPIAFGIGLEALWHGWIGPFASLLASEGSPILVGAQKPSLPDRISVPFGLALRPFGPMAAKHDAWGWRLLGGLGVQLGATVEHLRSSDDDGTTGGFHGAISLEVPLYGGPLQGGVSIRLAARLLITPEQQLGNPKGEFQEPLASGQFFAGVAYTP